MVLENSNGSDKGLNDWIWDEEMMNPLAIMVASKEILENNCLRLGRRKEEETRDEGRITEVISQLKKW